MSLCLLYIILNTENKYSQEVNEALYLSHDGGGEQAVVIHSHPHRAPCPGQSCWARSHSRWRNCHWGGEGNDDTSLASSLNQWDGDSQGDIRAEDPCVITRDSGIIKNVDPAAMTRNGCSEVLQQRVTDYYHESGENKSHLKDLEFPRPPTLSRSSSKAIVNRWSSERVRNDIKAATSRGRKQYPFINSYWIYVTSYQVLLTTEWIQLTSLLQQRNGDSFPSPFGSIGCSF